MTHAIDLFELATRESEKVEWKENDNDKNIVKSIVKTISAFANDLANMGGGYIVCGAREGKDEFGFPKVEFVGLNADKLREIEGKVLQHCRDYISPSVAPIVEELENPNDKTTKILVFIVLSTGDAHTYRDGELANYFVRISRETRIAKNGLLTQLLIKKRKIDFFDKRMAVNTTADDIDVLALRQYLSEMRLLNPLKKLEDYLSDTEQIAELVYPLMVKSGLDGRLRPRNFALLMFGKSKAITTNFPYAHIVYSVYKGYDRSDSFAERIEITGSIIEMARNTIQLLNLQATTLFDKTSNLNPNQSKYPIRALYEAVINAIVHRDYEIIEPIRVTVFINRIEIFSPGALHWAIDPKKFLNGQASPSWRNQSFAYLFNKLQLSQSEGQGIPTILKLMRQEGCPDPVFELGTDSITCILYAHPRYLKVVG